MALQSLPEPAPDQTSGEPPLPFRSTISLQPLLRAWHAERCAHPVFARFARDVHELQQQHRELFEPTEDLDRFRDAEELVKLLLSPVLSNSTGPHNLVAVARPFTFDFIYATAGFRTLLLDADGVMRARPKIDPNKVSISRELAVYAQIARQCYDLDLALDPSPTFVVDEGGLSCYYQLRFDTQFLEVECSERARTLSAADAARLRGNLRDLNLWREILPAQHYELRGVVLVHVTDITSREAIAAMQQAFASGTPLISQPGIKLLTRSARDALRQPELNARLLYAQGGKAFMIRQSGCGGHDGCLISNSRQFDYSDFAGSIYEQAKKTDFGFVADVERELDPANPLHRILRDEGVKSLLVFALRDEGKIVGLLELDFPDANIEPGGIALKVGDLLSIVALGLKQGRQYLEQNISAVIQKKCSVVHPAVEWRFRQAAFNMITGEQSGGLEPIVFREVYPLFSQADIKDSSTYRNQAILADLRAQLQMARSVLLNAQKERDMPLLAEMDFRIEGYLESLREGLRSGDELSMSSFFKEELEPMFPQLAALGGRARLAIDTYQSRLDPRYGALHEKRSEYEQSVQQINDAIAQFLAEEELQAQAVYPHYFEKTFTDGAEMMLYVGASLVEDGRFDMFYLRNLRLWQLRVSCQIAQLCESLRPQLKLPLRATHLVLVQNAPLSISFSETERDFIVDGAYNTRYEIMKKRIDKALVEDGSERLTQPGKIAIVYSHDNEAAEYRRYLRYLQHQGWLGDEIEELELEAMQGVQGLRALRVTVEPAAQQRLAEDAGQDGGLAALLSAT